MFLGHLQVWFYVRTLIFILQTWKQASYEEFWHAHWASGVHQIKKLHKTKSYCFWVTLKFCFMQDTRIPNYYFANLETQPIWGILKSTLGLQAASNQNVALMQKIMLLGHLQVYARPPNSQLLFSEPGNRPFSSFWQALSAWGLRCFKKFN